MIKKEGHEWVIFDHTGHKELGEYSTKKAADKRLGQIEYFKHQHNELNNKLDSVPKMKDGKLFTAR